MLQVLGRYYIHHGETPAELDTLARTARHLMSWVMRELGPVLTALPLGPSHQGLTAVPRSTLPDKLQSMSHDVGTHISKTAVPKPRPRASTRSPSTTAKHSGSTH